VPERTEGKPIASPDDTLEVALSLARAGWPVFPVKLVPIVEPDGTKKVDKRPLVKWLEGASADAEQVATWWGGQFSGAWIGVHAERAGLVVVDEDVDKGEGSGRANLKAAGIKLPRTFRYRTRSGGRHHLYTAPAGRALTIAKGRPVPGIDIRAGNGLMVYYGPALDERPELSPAPDWALFDRAPKAGDRAAGASVTAWLERARPGKPTKPVRQAFKAVTNDLGHDEMLEAVTGLVKLGSERGAADAYERARSVYIEGRPDRARDWDNAAEGSVRRLGLPPVTFALTKAERRAIRDRNKPVTIPLSEGAELFDEVRRQVRRFVVLPSDEHEVAVTLWIIHTHLVDRFDSTPRLWIHSPEPGSGKSRTLEVLAKLTHDAVETMNTSVAFLARRIDAGDPAPCVLFDEVDTLFGTRARDAAAEELRGILNSGHRRGAKYSRAATRGKEVVLEEFNTFAPVAMAGLGDLPDTIRTRSISVPMRRRNRDELVEPYRERQNGGELESARQRIEAWSRSARTRIGDPWPDMPEGITDRDADVWEPLLAVADAAGGAWPELAREAALVIVGEAKSRPASLGTRLLADVRRVIGDRERIRSIDLLGEILALEDSPWADLGGKGPIDSRFLGRHFDAYGIRPAHSIRFDPSATGGHKGWNRGDFADAFARYLTDTLTTFTTTDNS
jgi:hypothetical protein